MNFHPKQTSKLLLLCEDQQAIQTQNVSPSIQWHQMIDKVSKLFPFNEDEQSISAIMSIASICREYPSLSLLPEINSYPLISALFSFIQTKSNIEIGLDCLSCLLAHDDDITFQLLSLGFLPFSQEFLKIPIESSSELISLFLRCLRNISGCMSSDVTSQLLKFYPIPYTIKLYIYLIQLSANCKDFAISNSYILQYLINVAHSDLDLSSIQILINFVFQQYPITSSEYFLWILHYLMKQSSEFFCNNQNGQTIKQFILNAKFNEKHLKLHYLLICDFLVKYLPEIDLPPNIIEIISVMLQSNDGIYETSGLSVLRSLINSIPTHLVHDIEFLESFFHDLIVMLKNYVSSFRFKVRSELVYIFSNFLLTPHCNLHLILIENNILEFLSDFVFSQQDFHLNSLWIRTIIKLINSLSILSNSERQLITYHILQLNIEDHLNEFDDSDSNYEQIEILDLLMQQLKDTS